MSSRNFSDGLLLSALPEGFASWILVGDLFSHPVKVKDSCDRVMYRVGSPDKKKDHQQKTATFMDPSLRKVEVGCMAAALQVAAQETELTRQRDEEQA